MYSHEQLKLMDAAAISISSQRHIQSVIEELIETALAAAPTPAEAPADVVRDADSVGYLYTHVQSGEYHVSDYDDDYRGPERVLWCIEPVYRRTKG